MLLYNSHPLFVPNWRSSVQAHRRRDNCSGTVTGPICNFTHLVTANKHHHKMF